MRKTMLVAIVLALLAAACSSTESGSSSTTSLEPGTTSTEGGTTSTEGTGGSSNGGNGTGGTGASGAGITGLAVSLQQFDECDALLAWIRTEASERVGPYGFGDGGYPYAVEDGFRGPTTAVTGELLASDSGLGSAASEESFSTTNVQEVGVDEPDIVKTDGERVYLLVDDELHVVDATASSPRRLDTLRFRDEYPMELLLGEDRLYVVSSRWIDVEALETRGLPVYGQEILVVTEVAIGNAGDLTVTARLELSGSYVTARQVDGGARLVVRHNPQNSLPFVFPATEQAEDRARAANREIVEESVLEDWLPWYTLTTRDGEERSGLLTECDRVAAPQEFSGMSTLSVLTLDLGEDLDTGDALTLFGAADTVYASPSSLYAATYAFPEFIPFAEEVEDPDPEFSTEIHKFDITDPAGATYVASGEVEGRLLNQFAMSEQDGYLRVATTEGSPWFCCEEESVSSVVVMETDGDELVKTGIVRDLGVGESIFGVRFVGDRGYVVTFRQTDPLYVIDLSDPTSPQVEGELKITGYSAYLHPVSEDLVLGVGQEATRDGSTIGTKVSLFDVSDPADPREIDRWVLEGSSSMVEWDHRAFLYWAPEELAVVPVESWRGDPFGAVALTVIDGKLSERGTIVQGEAPTEDINPECRFVEPDDVDEENEIFWIMQEGGRVLVCPDGETAVSSGYDCERLENFGFTENDLGSIGPVGEDEVIDICWPRYEPGREIRRSIVIGDTLWTVGYQTIQANDLKTLEPLGTLGL